MRGRSLTSAFLFSPYHLDLLILFLAFPFFFFFYSNSLVGRCIKSWSRIQTHCCCTHLFFVFVYPTFFVFNFILLFIHGWGTMHLYDSRFFFPICFLPSTLAFTTWYRLHPGIVVLSALDANATHPDSCISYYERT